MKTNEKPNPRTNEAARSSTESHGSARSSTPRASSFCAKDSAAVGGDCSETVAKGISPTDGYEHLEDLPLRDSARAVLLRAAFDRGYRVNADGDVVAPSGRIRKPIARSTGYYEFTYRLRKGEPARGVSHHQLCAYQKFGDLALRRGVHVRHLDGNPLNNRPENIDIGTARENALDRDPEARIAHARRGAAKVRKLSPEQVAELRRDRRAGMSYADIGEKYGIAKGTISYIVNNKTYRGHRPSSREKHAASTPDP